MMWKMKKPLMRMILSKYIKESVHNAFLNIRKLHDVASVLKNLSAGTSLTNEPRKKWQR